MSHNNLPAGQRYHNGAKVPANARILIRSDRECYVSCLVDTHLIHGAKVKIKYLDDGSFELLSYGEGSMYLPFCVEPIKNKK